MGGSVSRPVYGPKTQVEQTRNNSKAANLAYKAGWWAPANQSKKAEKNAQRAKLSQLELREAQRKLKRELEDAKEELKDAKEEFTKAKSAANAKNATMNNKNARNDAEDEVDQLDDKVETITEELRKIRKWIAYKVKTYKAFKPARVATGMAAKAVLVNAPSAVAAAASRGPGTFFGLNTKGKNFLGRGPGIAPAGSNENKAISKIANAQAGNASNAVLAALKAANPNPKTKKEQVKQVVTAGLAAFELENLEKKVKQGGPTGEVLAEQINQIASSTSGNINNNKSKSMLSRALGRSTPAATKKKNNTFNTMGFNNFPVPSQSTKSNKKPSISGYASFGGRRRGTHRR